MLPCVLTLNTFSVRADTQSQTCLPINHLLFQGYTAAVKAKGDKEAGDETEEATAKPSGRGKGKKKDEDSLTPTVQGALLLQSVLRLHEPHNDIVLERCAQLCLLSIGPPADPYPWLSLASLPMEEVLALAHHPTSSRVLDVVLESPTVPPKARRRLITSFIGHFHTLVDDRIGSRVGDRCWDVSDPYLRVSTFHLPLGLLATLTDA